MPETANPTDYERSDAPPGLLVALAVGLAVTVIGVMIALAFLFPNALADCPKGPVQPLPPAPRLQIEPRGDLIAYETAKTRRLESYGWANRARGRVHVPVEAAMRDVAAKGWRDDAE